jgi:CHAT domain-containing protein
VAYGDRIRGEKALNLEQAINHFNAALRVNTQKTFPQEWAMLQNNLGTVFGARILGDLAKNREQSIVYHHNALKVCTRDTFAENWASSQHNLGVAYYRRIQGDQTENIEQAIACFRKSLQIYTRSIFPQDWAQMQKKLGMAFLERQKGEKERNLERAIHYLQNALQIYTQPEFPEQWAEIQKILGVLYWKRRQGSRSDNLERSIAYYQNALHIYQQSEFPESWAETQNALAMAYRSRIQGDRQDNLQQAIACCQAALNVRTQAALPNFHAESLLNLGLLYTDTQQLQLAFDTFAKAIQTIEALRDDILSGDIAKQKLAQQWHELYSNIVEVCLQLAVDDRQYLEEAIVYIERSKTRTLVELILSRNLNSIFPPEIVSELQHLQAEIQQGQASIQTGIENPVALIRQLQQLRQQRNELQDRYLLIGSSFELAPFQATLDNHTAILGWYIANDKILTFILASPTYSSSETPYQVEVEGFLHTKGSQGFLTVWQSSLQDLKDLVDWLQVYLNDYYRQRENWKKQLTQRLEQLAQILHLDLLLTQLPKTCNSLILIPHRFLNPLPLHALPISRGTLFSQFPGGVSYAPSCQLLQLIKIRKKPNFSHLFAIQNPTSDLVYADVEIEAIRQHFEVSTTLQKTLALKSAIDSNVFKSAHCIHFACHGFSDLISPFNSVLELADTSLSLGEIFSLNLQQTRLVTLSACETGLTDPVGTSSEYIGISSGFLYAGASNVVSSLWTVNDLSTALLMIKFYQNLRTDLSVALALNQAETWLRDISKQELEIWIIENKISLDASLRIALRRRLNKIVDGDQPFQSPFYWAAFCAIGY